MYLVLGVGLLALYLWCCKAHFPKVMLFSVNYCPYCQQVWGEWAKFAAIARGLTPGLSVERIDCETNRGAATKYGVTSFPTILYVAAAGATPVLYDGERTAAGWQAWVKTLANKDGQ